MVLALLSRVTRIGCFGANHHETRRSGMPEHAVAYCSRAEQPFGHALRQSTEKAMRTVLAASFAVALSGILATLAAQTAVTCAAPAFSAPIPSVSAVSSNLVISWTAVSGAVGYGVTRKNPDGTCWNITPQGTTSTSVQQPMPSTVGTYQYQV